MNRIIVLGLAALSTFVLIHRRRRLLGLLGRVVGRRPSGVDEAAVMPSLFALLDDDVDRALS